MIQIAVSEVEAQAICESATPVVVVDPQGNPLGQITPVAPDVAAQPGMTAERWAEIKHRMREPGEYVAFQQIRERLIQLDAS